MNIFESLENLNVSEACFDDIIGMVEGFIEEGHNLKMLVNRAYKDGKIDANKSVNLGNKAYRIPSSNDIHVDDEGNFNYDNITGKSSTKEGGGNIETDFRHKRKGRNLEELRLKRLNDEKNEYRQATEKAKRKHAEKVSEACFNEIMDMVEEIISEYTDLQDVVIRSYNKGKIDSDKFGRLVGKALDVPSNKSFYHEPKEKRNSLGQKGNQLNIKQFSGKTDKRRVKEFDKLSPEEKVTKRTEEKKNKRSS